MLFRSLLLPGNDQEAIASRIEQIKAICRYAGPGGNSQDLVSLSVGAAVYPRDGADADQLLAEADRRMYKVKQERKAMWATFAGSIAKVDVTTIQ